MLLYFMEAGGAHMVGTPLVAHTVRNQSISFMKYDLLPLSALALGSQILSWFISIPCCSAYQLLF